MFDGQKKDAGTCSGTKKTCGDAVSDSNYLLLVSVSFAITILRLNQKAFCYFLVVRVDRITVGRSNRQCNASLRIGSVAGPRCVSYFSTHCHWLERESKGQLVTSSTNCRLHPRIFPRRPKPLWTSRWCGRNPSHRLRAMWAILSVEG